MAKGARIVCFYSYRDSEQRPEGVQERRHVGEEGFRQGNNKWVDMTYFWNREQARVATVGG